MKFRYFSVLAIAVLLFNSVGMAVTDTRRGDAAKKRASARLIAMLPASDGIAVVDSKRLWNDALPKVLTANQPMLGQIVSGIDEMQARTGIDLRKFDQLVVGVAMKQVSPTDVDYEPVAIASGEVDAAAVISAAKAAAKGSVREEVVGTRTVYVFTLKDGANRPAAATGKLASALEKLANSLARKDVAVAAYDPTTVIIGSPARVKQTLQSRSNNDTDVRALIPARESAVIAFAARTNGMLGKLLPLETDMLGANLGSIQYLSGSMDVAGTSATVNLMARTQKPDQAQGLKETLDGLQVVGKAFLGSSKRPDQQVYGRMVQNARISSRGADVMLDLTIPQADIDTLIGGIK